MNETLRYIGPAQHHRDEIDHLLENVFLSMVRVEVSGLENIPRSGAFVLGFMPHSGWMEPTVIDHFIRKIRPPPVWITKVENTKGVPSVLLGRRRFIFIDREEPQPSTVKEILKVLEHPQAIVASAIEGTRRGNPDDPADFLTLGKAKSGLVRIAQKRGVPVLPVVILGAQVMPEPEKIKVTRGTSGVIFEAAKAILTPDKPLMTVHFAPLYSAHLQDIGTRGSDEVHTDYIVRQIIVPEIIAMDPNYPLGPYTPS